MENKIIIVGLLLCSITTSAQIGINTNDPIGILHINGGNGMTDTDPTNDVMISKPNGNMSIGHIDPTVKLDIKTEGTIDSPVYGFKLSDGNQAINKVLYSDANGVGTWRKLTIFSGQDITGSFHWAAYTSIGNINWNRIASLTISPGSHMIYTKIHILNSSSSGNVRTYIGTKDIGLNNSNPQDIPILGSTNFQPLMGRDFEITQSFVYNNVTDNNVTLYFNLQSDSNAISRSVYTFNNVASFKGVSLIENYFFSTPVD
ncbi:hypothetical protein [Chryseobacterium sp.]|uniref:hypothetical protein n=1 Tax=Chryseobacterium sp. TaxID=1871047 RepID=UPI0031DA6029